MSSNFERYSSIIRYLITMIAAPIAARLALDATQTSSLVDWVMTLLATIITFGPLVWSQVFRPSDAAMTVAKEADKVMAGDKKQATVKTPDGLPDIKITNANANVGHG